MLDNHLTLVRAQFEEDLGKDRTPLHLQFVVETAARLNHSFDDITVPRCGPLATVRGELLSIRDYTRPLATVRDRWRHYNARRTDITEIASRQLQNCRLNGDVHPACEGVLCGTATFPRE